MSDGPRIATHHPCDSEREAAYHAAAHSTLQWAFALGVGDMLIAADGSGFTAVCGHYGYGDSRVSDTYVADDKTIFLDDDTSNLYLHASEAFWLRHAVASFAGPEAERRLAGEGWKSLHNDDEHDATSSLLGITEDDGCIDALRVYARLRARILVAKYWPVIHALACRLVADLSIPGEQASELIRQQFNAAGITPTAW